MRASLISSFLAIALIAVGCAGQQGAVPASAPSSAAAAAPAPSGPSVNTPTFTDGDTYSIRLYPDTASGLQLPADLDLVVKHDGDSVVFASKQTPKSDAGALTLVFDAQMCVTQTQVNDLVLRYRPCDESAQFPLQVGKSWTARYGQSTGGGEFLQQTGTGTVVGMENIKVPAGTFNAYRVDVRHGPEIRTSSWWVPDPVGFAVKVESSSPQQLNFVLVSYKRAAVSH